MSDSGESKSRAGRIIGGIAAAVITVGAITGGVAVWNGVAQAKDAHAAYVASDHVFSSAMAESKADDQQVQADAVQQQHIANVNAQVQAAEDAKAAAAAAAQAAAEAAAAQQAQDRASDDGGDDYVGSAAGSGGAASGTPLPMRLDTDPNSGTYGQQVIAEDPGLFCAAHSASTINGVPTCD